MLMAAPVTSTSPPAFGTPVALFKTPAYRATQAGLGTRTQYDVSPDGKRILVNVALTLPETPPAHVLLNWTSLLKR